MCDPKISVILTIYNSEKVLERCIGSVLAQSFTDFELICINDVSSDGSKEIIDRFRLLDSRIILVNNSTNLGHGGSRNAGVLESKGEYIFNIDPDDTIPVDALKTLYQYAIVYDSDVVKGAYEKKQCYGYKERLAKGDIIDFSLYRKLPLVNTRVKFLPELLKTHEGHWTYLYKKSILKDKLWPTNLTMGQDAVFLIKLLVSIEKITIIGDVVYHYLENVDSAMGVFSFKKYVDVIRWRCSLFLYLQNSDYKNIGEFYLEEYFKLFWHERFLIYCQDHESPNKIFSDFLNVFEGYASFFRKVTLSKNTPIYLRDFFNAILYKKNPEKVFRVLVSLDYLSNEESGSVMLSRKAIEIQYNKRNNHV